MFNLQRHNVITLTGW